MSGHAAPARASPLLAAAKAFEARVVIPHCATCARPCCALTDVVLELSPTEATDLYRIERGRPLAPALRRQRGRYYAHGAPCPAFDVVSHRCGVYETPHKPRGCSDFPLYQDGDELVADLRCEAVRAALPALEDALVDALARGETLDVIEDADHPEFFARFAVGREGAT